MGFIRIYDGIPSGYVKLANLNMAIDIVDFTQLEKWWDLSIVLLIYQRVKIFIVHFNTNDTLLHYDVL